MKRALLAFLMLLAMQLNAFAQCAMCRATLENNVSNGNANVAANLNFGILYLFAMPYLAAILIGYFWYRKSRQTQSAKL